MAAFYNCDVIRAGPGGDNTIYIMLRDKEGAFPERWFVALPAQQKEMLATALTAVTTGLSVRASLDDTNENTQINRLYIQEGSPQASITVANFVSDGRPRSQQNSRVTS